MLREQALEELDGDIEPNDDAVEAYIRREFENNYGIPLYEKADADEAPPGAD